MRIATRIKSFSRIAYRYTWYISVRLCGERYGFGCVQVFKAMITGSLVDVASYCLRSYARFPGRLESICIGLRGSVCRQ